MVTNRIKAGRGDSFFRTVFLYSSILGVAPLHRLTAHSGRREVGQGPWKVRMLIAIPPAPLQVYHSLILVKL